MNTDKATVDRYLDRKAAREAVTTARLTAKDRQLVELAADARGVSVSAYVAAAASRAARRDLLTEGARGRQQGET